MSLANQLKMDETNEIDNQHQMEGVNLTTCSSSEVSCTADSNMEEILSNEENPPGLEIALKFGPLAPYNFQVSKYLSEQNPDIQFPNNSMNGLQLELHSFFSQPKVVEYLGEEVAKKIRWEIKYQANVDKARRIKLNLLSIDFERESLLKKYKPISNASLCNEKLKNLKLFIQRNRLGDKTKLSKEIQKYFSYLKILNSSRTHSNFPNILPYLTSYHLLRNNCLADILEVVASFKKIFSQHEKIIDNLLGNPTTPLCQRNNISLFKTLCTKSVENQILFIEEHDFLMKIDEAKVCLIGLQHSIHLSHPRFGLETKEIDIMCDKCQLYFSNLKEFLEHEAAKHVSELKSKLMNIAKTVEQPGVCIVCPICHKATGTLEVLLKHMGSFHEMVQLKLTFKCPVCNEKFANKMEFNSHAMKMGFTWFGNLGRVCSFTGCNFTMDIYSFQAFKEHLFEAHFVPKNPNVSLGPRNESMALQNQDNTCLQSKLDNDDECTSRRLDRHIQQDHNAVLELVESHLPWFSYEGEIDFSISSLKDSNKPSKCKDLNCSYGFGSNVYIAENNCELTSSLNDLNTNDKEESTFVVCDSLQVQPNQGIDLVGSHVNLTEITPLYIFSSASGSSHEYFTSPLHKNILNVGSDHLSVKKMASSNGSKSKHGSSTLPSFSSGFDCIPQVAVVQPSQQLALAPTLYPALSQPEERFLSDETPTHVHVQPSVDHFSHDVEILREQPPMYNISKSGDSSNVQYSYHNLPPFEAFSLKQINDAKACQNEGTLHEQSNQTCVQSSPLNGGTLSVQPSVKVFHSNERIPSPLQPSREFSSPEEGSLFMQPSKKYSLPNKGTLPMQHSERLSSSSEETISAQPSNDHAVETIPTSNVKSTSLSDNFVESLYQKIRETYCMDSNDVVDICDKLLTKVVFDPKLIEKHDEFLQFLQLKAGSSEKGFHEHLLNCHKWLKAFVIKCHGAKFKIPVMGPVRALMILSQLMAQSDINSYHIDFIILKVNSVHQFVGGMELIQDKKIIAFLATIESNLANMGKTWCTYCPTKFANISALSEHLERRHNDLPSLRKELTLSGEYASDGLSSSLSQKRQSRTPLAGTKCRVYKNDRPETSRIADPDAYVVRNTSTRKVNSPLSKDKFPCNNCTFDFHTVTALEEHVAKTHPSSRPRCRKQPKSTLVSQDNVPVVSQIGEKVDTLNNHGSCIPTKELATGKRPKRVVKMNTPLANNVIGQDHDDADNDGNLSQFHRDADNVRMPCTDGQSSQDDRMPAELEDGQLVKNSDGKTIIMSIDFMDVANQMELLEDTQQDLPTEEDFLNLMNKICTLMALNDVEVDAIRPYARQFYSILKSEQDDSGNTCVDMNPVTWNNFSIVLWAYKTIQDGKGILGSSQEFINHKIYTCNFLNLCRYCVVLMRIKWKMMRESCKNPIHSFLSKVAPFVKKLEPQPVQSPTYSFLFLRQVFTEAMTIRVCRAFRQMESRNQRRFVSMLLTTLKAFPSITPPEDITKLMRGLNGKLLLEAIETAARSTPGLKEINTAENEKDPSSALVYDPDDGSLAGAQITTKTDFNQPQASTKRTSQSQTINKYAHKQSQDSIKVPINQSQDSIKDSLSQSQCRISTSGQSQTAEVLTNTQSKKAISSEIAWASTADQLSFLRKRLMLKEHKFAQELKQLFSLSDYLPKIVKIIKRFERKDDTLEVGKFLPIFQQWIRFNKDAQPLDSNRTEKSTKTIESTLRSQKNASSSLSSDATMDSHKKQDLVEAVPAVGQIACLARHVFNKEPEKEKEHMTEVAKTTCPSKGHRDRFPPPGGVSYNVVPAITKRGPSYHYFCLDCEGCNDPSCQHFGVHPRVPLLIDVASHILETEHTNLRKIDNACSVMTRNIAYHPKYGNKVRHQWKQMIIEEKPVVASYPNPRTCISFGCQEEVSERNRDAEQSFPQPLDLFLHIQEKHLPKKRPLPSSSSSSLSSSSSAAVPAQSHGPQRKKQRIIEEWIVLKSET